MLTTHAQLDMFTAKVECNPHANEKRTPLTPREKMTRAISVLCLTVAAFEVAMSIYLLKM